MKQDDFLVDEDEVKYLEINHDVTKISINFEGIFITFKNGKRLHIEKEFLVNEFEFGE